jgi:hypothetical protein
VCPVTKRNGRGCSEEGSANMARESTAAVEVVSFPVSFRLHI